MKIWKISFWITLILLLVSNLFWVYQVIDTAVGHGYYQVNCEEYKSNSDILEFTLRSYSSKDELIRFLEDKNIQFETYHKADNENYVVIGKLGIQFDDDGNRINEEK